MMAAPSSAWTQPKIDLPQNSDFLSRHDAEAEKRLL